MNLNRLPVLFLFITFHSYSANAQVETLHGDFSEYRNGLHSGNQLRTTFYNDGHYGITMTGVDEIGGEWPINSGHAYLWDATPFTGSEVIDATGEFRHIVSGTPVLGGDPPSAGQKSPDGEWWTFLPLHGFAHPDTNKVAMSKWKWAWPAYWPDKMDDAVDPGWPGSWNGYFGKDVFSADEESYWVIDDYQFREFLFYPDQTDSSRRGLGMRVTCRGFQWSNALVEDAIFALYDVQNIGTHLHDKMVFGFKMGINPGGLVNMMGGDGWDSFGAYSIEYDLGYTFDKDLIGEGGWYPIGYFGGAFLESPSNAHDGIDNDGDGKSGPGPVIDEAFFAPKTVQAGEVIVLIDYATFDRHLSVLPEDTLRIEHLDYEYKFYPGKELGETPFNLFDDNLNGLIDENNGKTFGEPGAQITTFLYVGQKYIDFFKGEGSDNILLEERRDDGIDNDGDWNIVDDDVGLDGIPGTGDQGEGDGTPTSGRGTHLPGEPHIDKTDIDEGDMLGLTSFVFYDFRDIPLFEDELLWDVMFPGRFDDRAQDVAANLLFSSGYFPMKPGQRERFSLAIVAGDNLEDILDNKFWVARAYSENYNFAQAPLIPTLTAVPGDNRVTLYWDDVAESSYDPISGHDFEGYRIYRSTDPGFNDMTPVTDYQGSVVFRKPLAQFDLVNEHAGISPGRIRGQSFWLGDNTGLVHSYIDSTVQNGTLYYYAVTSYDHGIASEILAPTECAKYISVNMSGIIDKGRNIAIVRPEAPAAGYRPPEMAHSEWSGSSTATGSISLTVMNPGIIREAIYRITFEDTVRDDGIWPYPVTQTYTLEDITNDQSPDTLTYNSRLLGIEDEKPITHGFRLAFRNLPRLEPNHEESRWNREGLFGFQFRAGKIRKDMGLPRSADYRIEFGDPGMDTSVVLGRLEAIPVNFKVFNVTEDKQIQFAFDPKDGKDGLFSAFTDRNFSDIIIFVEKNEQDSLVLTWGFELVKLVDDTTRRGPQAGDVIHIVTHKPFLSHDVFEFEMRPDYIDETVASKSLDLIRVVPNPYRVTNSWEPLNPYTNGRGPRELHFINLPHNCTIRIFNIRGQLVDKLERDSANTNGTYIWDMLTKDRLDIAYGIYVYHVDAGDIGSRIGKFAVIK